MALVIVLTAVRAYRKVDARAKQSLSLLFILAAVPPIFLFVASMPPLTSSFVERYLLPATVASSLFVGAIFAIGLRGTAIGKQIIIYGLTVALLIGGLSNMYYYGNYNKNSRTGIETKAVVNAVKAKAEDGTPIIAGTPWVFYEATFYDSPEHPIYFIDQDVQYDYGSLDMLKYNDQHKIKDLSAFTKQHSVVWYVTYVDGELTAPRPNWTKIDEVSVTNHVDGKTVYKAAKFAITTEE